MNKQYLLTVEPNIRLEYVCVCVCVCVCVLMTCMT